MNTQVAAHDLVDRREALGLTLLDLARKAECSAEIVLHAEFGVDMPRDRGLRDRLAGAYRLTRPNYDRMTVQAARRFRARTRLLANSH